MKQLKKTILTLVALLAVTTGAWADETPLVTINSTGYTTFTSGSKTFDDKVTVTFSNSVSNDGDHWGWYADDTASLLTVAGINGYTITSCKFYTFEGTAKTGYTVAGESPSVYLNNDYVYTDDSKSENLGKFGISKIEVYGGVASATKYDLTLATGSDAHGTVAFTVGGAAATQAKKDDVVTVSVTPNEGYSAKDVTVRAYTSWEAASEILTGGGDNPGLVSDITVTKNETDGTWQFTMPEANVWIVVTYAKNLQNAWIQAIADQTYTGAVQLRRLSP